MSTDPGNVPQRPLRDLVAEAITEEETAMARRGQERTQAWGTVEKTKTKAIESAADAHRRLTAETRRTTTSHLSYDEVRPTNTGYQARVSADTVPGRKDAE